MENIIYITREKWCSRDEFIAMMIDYKENISINHQSIKYFMRDQNKRIFKKKKMFLYYTKNIVILKANRKLLL